MENWSTQRLGLVYTAGRIGCLAAVAGVLYLLGVHTWALAFGAVLLSMPLSYVLLKPVRLAFAGRLEQGAKVRKAEKAKLRAALRGDDDADEPSPASPDEQKTPE